MTPIMTMTILIMIMMMAMMILMMMMMMLTMMMMTMMIVTPALLKDLSRQSPRQSCHHELPRRGEVMIILLS